LEHDLRQVDFAKGLGVDEMTIVNWEIEKTRPTRRTRKMLMKKLGINI